MKWKERRESQPASLLSFKRFVSGNVKAHYGILAWHYSGKSDALTLTVNKAVLFHGVRLFGNSRGSEYEVKLTIKNANVTGTYTSQQDSDGVPGYDVMLAKPIAFLPDEEVTITATIKGPTSCWGTRGKSSVKVDDIVVTFRDTILSLRKDMTRGQFYKAFLSEL